MNPLARFRDPITLADHQASRWVAEPLHLLDCCMVSNGGVAVVVTSAERAGHLAAAAGPRVGLGADPPRLPHGARLATGACVSGAAIAGPRAMAMAGITPADVDVREIYDCYTYTTLITLEDYGFCAKGEGGALAASGALGPGGALPTNTGGGQLSSYYLWGMTPLSEAVIQVRGPGRRAPGRPRTTSAIVSGNGGVLDFHSTLVLGSRPALSGETMTDFRVERDDASAPFFDAARDGSAAGPAVPGVRAAVPAEPGRCADSDELEWQRRRRHRRRS